MLQENILFENAASFVTYILLAASMILCFFDRQKKMAAMLFIFAVLFGLYAHQIRFLAIISISVFGFLTYLFYDPNTNSILKSTLFFVIFILSTLLLVHGIPGYYNWKIYDHIVLGNSSAAFKFWLNFDNALVGFFLLLFGYKQYLVKNNYKEILLISWPFFVISPLILIGYSLIVHYVVFDPKFPSIISIWIFKMIFFTTIIEEVFFRFFIQDNLVKSLKNLNLKSSKILGLILASLIFAAFHYHGGLAYMTLAFIAGLLYGGIYLRTRFLGSSIALHFFVNFVHFIFFSYPYYQ